MAKQAHFWFVVDTSVSMARELLSSANTQLSEVISELRNYQGMSSLEISLGILSFGISCSVVLPMTPAVNVNIPRLQIGTDLTGNPGTQEILPLVLDRNACFSPEEAQKLPAAMSSCLPMRALMDQLTQQDEAELICWCLLTDAMLTDRTDVIRSAFYPPLASPGMSARTEKRFIAWFADRVEQAAFDRARLDSFFSPSVETKLLDPEDLAAGLSEMLIGWESEFGAGPQIQTVFG